MIFDWHRSNVGVNAQSVGIIHDEKHYLLTASPTIKPGEYQAMCNAVRVTKDLFGTITEAKTACEKWYRREVLGESWDAREALATFIGDCENTPPNFTMANAILDNFEVAPKR